jgi:hypothetical protein
MMIRQKQLFAKLVDLVEKTLLLLEKEILDAYYIAPFKTYPEISYENGQFPRLTYHSMKPDVSEFFRRKNANFTPKIDMEVDELFQELVKILISIPEFYKYYKDTVSENDTFLYIHSENFIKDIIIGYYYLYEYDFRIDRLEAIYWPLENFIYAETLNFDLAVPILFTVFECDHFALTENMLIRRIDEDTHKAKFSIKTFSPAIADPLIYSATHELVLKNYTSPKQPTFYQYDAFGHPQIYPHDKIERFFSVLKLATDITSGYSQVIVHPFQWANRVRYDLKHLEGTSVRQYPNHFDDFYWTKENFPVVTEEDLTLLRLLLNSVASNPENKLEIALKIFYKSMMRQAEEDIIIDIIIALEMLLGDNEKSELTHKLALRITTLITCESKEIIDPMVIFNNVKKIYDYRSAVVHGSHKADQKREIKTEDQKTIPVVMLANNYLRQILKILILNPKYLSSKEIDKMMLVNQQDHLGIF